MFCLHCGQQINSLVLCPFCHLDPGDSKARQPYETEAQRHAREEMEMYQTDREDEERYKAQGPAAYNRYMKLREESRAAYADEQRQQQNARTTVVSGAAAIAGVLLLPVCPVVAVPLLGGAALGFIKRLRNH